MLVRISRGDLAPDTPAPLLESVGFLITRVHFRLHREFSAALAPLGIEPRHKGCLAALARPARSRRPSWPGSSGSAAPASCRWSTTWSAAAWSSAAASRPTAAPSCSTCCPRRPRWRPGGPGAQRRADGRPSWRC